MSLLLSCLSSLFMFLLYALLVIFVLLLIPIFYDFEVKTNSENIYSFLSINILLGIIQIEIVNNIKYIKILGLIRFRILDKEKDKQVKKEKVLSKKEIEEQEIENEFERKNQESFNRSYAKSNFIRRAKLSVYKFERKLKKEVYKLKRIFNSVNDYRYKMDLLSKILEFINKVIKIIRPRYSAVSLEFGTGNAELTAKLTGGISILATRYKNIYFKPNFNERMLKLETYMEGYISPFRLIYLIIKFMFSTPIRKIRVQINKNNKIKKQKLDKLRREA